MTIKAILYPKKVTLGAGILGGIAGGAVMYGVMSVLMENLGMGANCFAIIMGLITGQSYENALGPGITAHFLTSIAIGAAFCAIINVKKFEVHGFGKTIGLGITTGVIAYAIIFVPIAVTTLPTHMMDLMKMMPVEDMTMPDHMDDDDSMNSMDGVPMHDTSMSDNEIPDMSDETAMNTVNEKMNMEEMDQMMMQETENMLTPIMIGSFVSHITFGTTLGIVVVPILRLTSTKSGI